MVTLLLYLQYFVTVAVIGIGCWAKHFFGKLKLKRELRSVHRQKLKSSWLWIPGGWSQRHLGIIKLRKFEKIEFRTKIFLDGGDDLLDVGEDVDGRPLGVDDLGVVLCNDGSSLGVEVVDPLDDRVLSIVKVVPEERDVTSSVAVPIPEVEYQLLMPRNRV